MAVVSNKGDQRHLNPSEIFSMAVLLPSEAQTQSEINFSSFGLTVKSVDMGEPTALGRFAPNPTARVFCCSKLGEGMSDQRDWVKSFCLGNIPWL